MSTFAYIGKHTRGVRLELPSRTLTLDHGEPFDVDETEAALLDQNPSYERVAKSHEGEDD